MTKKKNNNSDHATASDQSDDSVGEAMTSSFSTALERLLCCKCNQFMFLNHVKNIRSTCINSEYSGDDENIKCSIFL